MKIYWDSSALVEALLAPQLRRRVADNQSMTRVHALGEVFSTLTGGKLGVKFLPDEAARMLKDLAVDLEFTDLTPKDALAAFGEAGGKGVRGGRVHDYLHAVAAHKGKAALLLTTDKNDFDGLFSPVEIV
jgi:predicted nucleic acid-binding protein